MVSNAFITNGNVQGYYDEVDNLHCDDFVSAMVTAKENTDIFLCVN